MKPYGLPARPIWPNFAIVSVMWAVVAWWAMLALALAWRFGLRRQIAASRVRRGLCPGCRYPVGEHERCPECGEPAPARRRRLVLPMPAHPAARRAVAALVLGVCITALHAWAVTQTRDTFAAIDRPGEMGLWMVFDRGTVHRLPGLVVFTLLWSFVAWCVVLMLAAVWRVGVRRPVEARRLRRGHCPRCRYNIEGLDCCPECGWTRGRPVKQPETRGEARALR